MVAYEFYSGNHKEGYDLVGILPERRSNSERINNESIMNWAKGLIGNHFDGRELFFIQVPIDEFAPKVS